MLPILPVFEYAEIIVGAIISSVRLVTAEPANPDTVFLNDVESDNFKYPPLVGGV